jgi:tetratricopeptide (TPR) repeat protein
MDLATVELPSSAIDRAIDELRGRQLGVFCGAGISLHSGIPLANNIVETVLDHLRIVKNDRQAFLDAKLPFELVMEVLLEVANSETLFVLFGAGRPNLNHVLLAKLAGAGWLQMLITTNFDTFLEDSLRNEQVHFSVVYKDDQLQNSLWDTTKPVVIKLHGTIGDSKSLALTIRGVATQSRAASRKEAIATILTRTPPDVIVVMGYSCSDVFDISPALISVQRSSPRILFVEHSSIAAHDAALANISTKTSNPFGHLGGQVLTCNTDDFIKKLWARYVSSSLPTLAVPPRDWEVLLANWFNELIKARGEAVCDYLAGTLLKRAGAYSASTEFLKGAVQSSSEDLSSAALRSIGDNYRDLGEYSTAIEYLRKALRVSVQQRKLSEEARILASLGVVFEDRKDHFRSISCYKRAMRRSRQAKDKKLEGICNGNAGIAYKNIGDPANIQRAIRYHQHALDLARAVGDKPSEGRTLGNLGIAHSDAGDGARAAQYYREALAVAKDLGDTRHIGIWAANAGMDLIDADPEEAAEYLHMAIAIFTKLRLRHYVTECTEALQRISTQRS